MGVAFQAFWDVIFFLFFVVKLPSTMRQSQQVITGNQPKDGDLC